MIQASFMAARAGKPFWRSGKVGANTATADSRTADSRTSCRYKGVIRIVVLYCARACMGLEKSQFPLFRARSAVHAARASWGVLLYMYYIPVRSEVAAGVDRLIGSRCLANCDALRWAWRGQPREGACSPRSRKPPARAGIGADSPLWNVLRTPAARQKRVARRPVRRRQNEF